MRIGLILALLATAALSQETWKDIAETDFWWTPAAEQKEAAEQAKVALAAQNSVGMAFVLIPAGKFTMGSPENEIGREDREVQHEVTLTRAFYLAKTEVTQAQWKAVMGTEPSWFKNAGADAPVEQVSWEDAVDFCNKLSEKEGLTKAYKADRSLDAKANGYRLPTEAEWEYACRAGTAGAYSGGSLDAMGWYEGNSGRTTRPVAQKAANAWGLHDMHGNVWEWCQDCYGSLGTEAVTDPVGSGSRSRVVRGGSWSDDAWSCRSAFRIGFEPGRRIWLFGFRPSRSP